ncbi:MAG: rhomboid family intramembrane serine protease [Nocardioidaceae bacterium]|nr:rhomboid family intramembrane serine protease [Nocardioidaceae bacterium]
MTNPPVGVPTCYRHSDRETWIRCQRCERPICPDCMRDASVGFQCPSCVAEGRRSVRQAKTTYGGTISANPGAVSIALIGMNVVVWVAIVATGRYTSKLFDLFGLMARGACREGNGYYPDIPNSVICSGGDTSRWGDGVSDGAVWQLFTNMFTHVEPWHLGFNMLALWVLGPQLERLLGRARYLSVYLLSGLTGSVVVYWFSDEQTATVGASGAIFGLMGALLVIGLKQRAQVQGLLLWVGINAVLTFTIPDVSWQGHAGGLVGGVVLTSILIFAPRERRTAVQVAGLSAVGVLLVAAAVLRTMTLT